MLRNVRTGSPPQVRGKQVYYGSVIADMRITPAGAGKTDKQRQRFDDFEDHPRRCGENSCNSSIITGKLGSPPQVRGKQSRQTFRLSAHRITPAGAGKTSKRNCSRRTRRDHPRRCGENDDGRRRLICTKGSPPQVRGKRRPTAV